MATTPHTGVTLLEQSQAQKEITINEALMRMDVLLGQGVIDKDLATPPGSPAAGAVYIVASGATGAWSGKANHVAYYDQGWYFIAPNEGMLLWLKDEDVFYHYNGSSWATLVTGGSSAVARLCEGRLTLTSGVPVTTSDVSAAGTLYFTPYVGNQIALYTGSSWSVLSFSETALSLASGFSAATLYDVFAYASGGTIALETVAWSTTTTRATPLTRQDGVFVKQGAPTRRYLGTFYTSSSTTTEDSKAKRYVWNYRQRVKRLMNAFDSASIWTYSTTGYRQANNNPANQLDFVLGVAEEPISANLVASVYNSTATARTVSVGIGLNSTTTASDRALAFQTLSTGDNGCYAFFESMVPAGRHVLTWLEQGAGTDTQTWRGSTYRGISGSVWG